MNVINISNIWKLVNISNIMNVINISNNSKLVNIIIWPNSGSVETVFILSSHRPIIRPAWKEL